MNQSSNFTEGKIYVPLIKFAVPVLFAIFLQAMYGAVDLLILGQFGDAADVSAVATGSHVMQSITSIITGLAMGTTILVGQRLGQKRPDEAGNVIGCSICIFAAAALLLTVTVVPFAPALSRVMQAPQQAFDGTVLYVRICAAGSTFIIAYNVLGSIFRGLGDSKTPLLAVFISCVINIAGDLLLVAVFHMGVAGAAIATVLAQAVSVLLSLALIKKRPLPFHFTKSSIRFHRGQSSQILKLGAPIALQDGLVSVSFLVITAIVNSLGVIPSAGVGVAEKLASFILLVPSSFSQTTSAFVAQNYGAGQYGRAKKALFYAVSTSFLVGLLMSYFSFFHGDLLAGIFSTDHEVVLAAWDYMKAYSIDCLLTAFMFCYTGYFNGCGKTGFVMIQGIIGAFLVRIPVSYLMSRLTPVSLFYVGLATPASTMVQIVFCLVYYQVVSKQLKMLSAKSTASIK